MKLGTLRYHDVNGKENVKKQLYRFYKQNNNFARASHLFVHFFSPFLHDYDVNLKCLCLSKYYLSTELAIIISLSPTSASGVIVLLKTPTKY